MNTRKMTLEEYKPELDAEAEGLRRMLPRMKAELRQDPEGCFGGRGNNFGYEEVKRIEDRLNWLTSQGYTIRTRLYIDLLQTGIDLTTIDKVIAKDHKLFIGGAPGYRQVKEVRGTPTEVNWVYSRDEGHWLGQEPPQAVIAAAEAVANYHNNTLLEWRGEFHCPRVYL